MVFTHVLQHPPLFFFFLHAATEKPNCYIFPLGHACPLPPAPACASTLQSNPSVAAAQGSTPRAWSCRCYEPLFASDYALCDNGAVQGIQMRVHPSPQIAQVLPLFSETETETPLFSENEPETPLFILKPLIPCRSLSDSFVSKPHDMEEMVGLGTKLSSCPYYASRSIFNPTITTLNP